MIQLKINTRPNINSDNLMEDIRTEKNYVDLINCILNGLKLINLNAKDRARQLAIKDIPKLTAQDLEGILDISEDKANELINLLNNYIDTKLKPNLTRDVRPDLHPLTLYNSGQDILHAFGSNSDGTEFNLDFKNILNRNAILSYCGRSTSDLRNILTTHNIMTSVAAIEKPLQTFSKDANIRKFDPIYIKRVCTSLGVDSTDKVNEDFLNRHKDDLLSHLNENFDAWKWCIIFNHNFTKYLNLNNQIVIKKGLKAATFYDYATYKNRPQLGIRLIVDYDLTNHTHYEVKNGLGYSCKVNIPSLCKVLEYIVDWVKQSKANTQNPIGPKQKVIPVGGADGFSYDYILQVTGLPDNLLKPLYTFVRDNTLGKENETALYDRAKSSGIGLSDNPELYIAAILYSSKYYSSMYKLHPEVTPFSYTEDLESLPLSNVSWVLDFCKNHDIPLFIINTRGFINVGDFLKFADTLVAGVRQEHNIDHIVYAYSHTADFEEISNFYNYGKFVDHKVNGNNYKAASVEAAYGMIKLNRLHNNDTLKSNIYVKLNDMFQDKVSEDNFTSLWDSTHKNSIADLQTIDITGDDARTIGHNWPGIILDKSRFKALTKCTKELKLELKNFIVNEVTNALKGWDDHDGIKMSVMQQLLISKYNNVPVFRTALGECNGNYIVHTIHGNGGDEWAGETNYLGKMLTILEDYYIMNRASGNADKPYAVPRIEIKVNGEYLIYKTTNEDFIAALRFIKQLYFKNETVEDSEVKKIKIEEKGSYGNIKTESLNMLKFKLTKN